MRHAKPTVPKEPHPNQSEEAVRENWLASTNDRSGQEAKSRGPALPVVVFGDEPGGDAQLLIFFPALLLFARDVSQRLKLTRTWRKGAEKAPKGSVALAFSLLAWIPTEPFGPNIRVSAVA